MAMKTQKEKLKEQEESRDFFCVVSDAFRIFARRSSRVCGSAWAFAGAVLIIVVWGLTDQTFHYSNTSQLGGMKSDAPTPEAHAQQTVPIQPRTKITASKVSM